LLAVAKGLEYAALVRENRSLKQFIESRSSLDNVSFEDLPPHI